MAAFGLPYTRDAVFVWVLLGALAGAPGEHYVADVLLGWIYAVASFAAIRWIARRLEARAPDRRKTIIPSPSR